MFFVSPLKIGALATLLSLAPFAASQQEQHGRKYKAPAPTAHIVVTVEKSFNSKPMPNAAVIFHAVRNGQEDGNLEVKTDPEGKATIDVIEIGSHLTVQVIAGGFATFAQELDVDSPEKELLVKMIRPRAQVSTYEDNDGKAAQVKPGVQEPPKALVPKPAPMPQPVAPQSVTPPAVTPQAVVPPTATPQAVVPPTATPQ